MERLSTGKRINSAADDAAGVAITSRLTSNLKGINQSIRNAMDAQALIDTAEGGLQETEALLQRIRELAVQAASDTNSSADRAALDAEKTQLMAEIDRIANSTTWAGQNLLDGTFSNKSFQVGGGTMVMDSLVSSINSVTSTALNVDQTSPGEENSGDFFVNKFWDENFGRIQFSWPSTGTTIELNGTLIELSATAPSDKGLELVRKLNQIGVDAFIVSSNNIVGIPLSNFSDYISGYNLPTSEFHFLGNPLSDVEDLGNFTYTPATYSLINRLYSRGEWLRLTRKVDTALQTLNSQRASLGALSNRIDHIVTNNTNTATNIARSISRIEDADFAAETTNLAKQQILQQAATAMLAQANASKQNILTLLNL